MQKVKNCLFSVIGGKNSNLEKTETESEIFYLKIYDILKNENYGGLYLYHGKRSPFEVKVKSKRVKLYIIKKDDYQSICDTYKNFIQRIHKKEKKNFKNIKNILIKTIDRFCHTHGISIKEEYQECIEKAIKDFNKSTLPNFLKNNTIFAHLFTNEIDEEINKTIKEFSIKLNKASTAKSKYNYKSYIKPKPMHKKLTAQQTIEKRMLENIYKQRKSFNVQYRPRKRSYNFLNKGSLGANIIQSFKPSYRDDFYVTKIRPSLNVDEINLKLFKKIKDEKNRLSEIRKNKHENNKNEMNNIIEINETKEKNEMNKISKEIEISEIDELNKLSKENEISEMEQMNKINKEAEISEIDEMIKINKEAEISEIDGMNKIIKKNEISERDEVSEINGINETIKINKIKPGLSIKLGDNKAIKNITFNYDDSEKESKKTIKLRQNDSESQGKEPITLNDLPESMKNLLRNRIFNENNFKNIYSKFKIEHISIEINDYKINTNYSNNNSLFDNSYLNSTNNMSYMNINNKYTKTFNSKVNKSITHYGKSNNTKYMKSISSYNQNDSKSKKDRSYSPKTFKVKKKKTRVKGANNSVKIKDISLKIKKELTNQNSTKLTLTPLHSSKIFSQMNNTNNLSLMNKFKRSSVTDHKNNIISKLNGEYDKKSNLVADDLSSTSVESFQIKRSYKNLNQESGGAYIKNKKLQAKTIKFIKEFDNNNKAGKRRKTEKRVRGRLTGNIDLQNLMKGNKKKIINLKN